MTTIKIKMILTKTVVDFIRELRRIETGTKEITVSNLYQFLRDDHRAVIDTFELLSDKISYLKLMYDYDNLLVNSYFLEDSIFVEKFPSSLLELVSESREIQRTRKNRKWYQYETFCTLNVGLRGCQTFLTHFIINKFHSYFQLPDYLILSVDSKAAFGENNVKLLLRNLLISRLNFILNGQYLPIVIDFSMPQHEVTSVFQPKYSNGTLHWHNISVNSNGDDIKKVTSLISKTMSDFDTNLKNFQSNNDFIFMKTDCNKNIQRNFGTCASWSTFLVLFFLADYDIFVQQARDHNPGLEAHSTLQFSEVAKFIKLYCQKLATQTKDTFALRKYNEVISDFEASIFYTIIELHNKAVHLGKPNSNSIQCMMEMIISAANDAGGVGADYTGVGADYTGAGADDAAGVGGVGADYTGAGAAADYTGAGAAADYTGVDDADDAGVDAGAAGPNSHQKKAALVAVHVDLFAEMFHVLRNMQEKLEKNIVNDFENPQRSISDEIRHGERLFDEFTFKLHQEGSIFEKIKTRQGIKRMNEKPWTYKELEDMQIFQKRLDSLQNSIEEKKLEVARESQLKPTLLSTKRHHDDQTRRFQLQQSIFQEQKEFRDILNRLTDIFRPESSPVGAYRLQSVKQMVRSWQEKWYNYKENKILKSLQKKISALDDDIKNQQTSLEFQRLVLFAKQTEELKQVSDDSEESDIELIKKEEAILQKLQSKRKIKTDEHEKWMLNRGLLLRNYIEFEDDLLKTPNIRPVKRIRSSPT